MPDGLKSSGENVSSCPPFLCEIEKYCISAGGLKFFCHLVCRNLSLIFAGFYENSY
jgi:hypothetical protein